MLYGMTYTISQYINVSEDGPEGGHTTYGGNSTCRRILQAHCSAKSKWVQLYL